jgi:hypothetical protein
MRSRWGVRAFTEVVVVIVAGSEDGESAAKAVSQCAGPAAG